MADIVDTNEQERKLAEREINEELDKFDLMKEVASLNANNYYIRQLNEKPKERFETISQAFKDDKISDYEFHLMCEYAIELDAKAKGGVK